MFGGSSIGQSKNYSMKVMPTSYSRRVRKWQCHDDAIYFNDGDLKEILHPHEDPLLVEVKIRSEPQITKVMIDLGSSVDGLYYEAFEKWATNLRVWPPSRKLSMISPTPLLQSLT